MAGWSVVLRKPLFIALLNKKAHCNLKFWLKCQANSLKKLQKVCHALFSQFFFRLKYYKDYVGMFYIKRKQI